MDQTYKISQPKAAMPTSASVPLSDIFFQYLSKWKWIVLSLLVCLSIAIVYILRTPKTYSQSTSLVIKSDDQGSGVADFSTFGLVSSNTNLSNEMSALKSPDMMEEVVKRLNLEISYFTPGRFHKNVAYGESLPLTVTFTNLPETDAASFKINTSSDGKITISDLKRTYKGNPEPQKSDCIYNGSLSSPINTIAGSIIISPTPFFEKGKEIELFVNRSSLFAATETYNKNLVVEPEDTKNSGDVVNISITDQSIQRADDILNTLISVYNDTWIKEKNQVAVATSNFINERLGVIEQELGNVDSDISSYKSQNLVPDVAQAANAYMQETQTLSQDILDLTNQLQMTRYIREYVVSPGNQNKLLPTNAGITNLSIQTQIEGYNKQMIERNNLAAKSSDKNPLVQNMDKDLSDMRMSVVASIDNSIANLKTQIQGLQGAQGAATAKLASNPTQAKHLLSIERQQKVKESLYLFLLQKREDNELNQAFTAYNTRVIKRPGGSTAPIAPKTINILAIATLLGIIIPFGVVYVKVTSNTKVRGRKDAESITAPLVGEIPMYKFGKNHSNAGDTILVEHGKRDIVNEAFRVLRTNVEFLRTNKGSCNVLGITSFNPGSGKSFITMNLAAALAIRKQRVLVIDGDFRHGSSSAYVGRPHKGLADYLAGNIDDVHSVIKDVEGTAGLQVLPVGKTPPNPTELLEDGRFEPMVEALRKEYDFIFIDCPPIELVADARIINMVVDRMLFVIRAGLFERSLLPEIDRLYEEKRYKNMAVILNGTVSDRSRRANAFGYGYGNGYDYGN